MYFSALKRLIGSVEEKMFYDVALLFLESQGYRSLSIVDGAGDGGRDVICSRSDLRIQLSVRKDWESKINAEATATRSLGKRHLIYITNRVISPENEAEFLTNNYKCAGEVDVSIYDLNRIATALSHSSLINRAYGTLGADPEFNLQPTVKEVALSSLLLFGVEAQDLRESVVQANIRATLLDNPEGVSEDDLIAQVSDYLPGVNIARLVTAAISRLRSAGAISGSNSNIMLSERDVDRLVAARANFNQLLKEDLESISSVSGLSLSLSRKLLTMARNIIVSGKSLDGTSDAQEQFRDFMASNHLRGKSSEIYDALSQASTVRQFQFGVTVDQIFSTDTFDIYRALGGRTDLTLVMDSNVALPLMLGLEFPSGESRYGHAVLALEQVCRSHGIGMMTPSVYVNEMAGHGRKALEYLEIYPNLPDEARSSLRNSRNAFLSHYSYIHEFVDITLDSFLAHFGIVAGASIRKLENRMLSILESHGINTGFSEWYDSRVRVEVESQKPGDFPVLIDHDASVATNLINDSKKGYIVATWDVVMRDVVQDLARVYVDNPARINDFLSVIDGSFKPSDRSEHLLFTLLHMDDEPARRLAEKVEKINSIDGAYQLKILIDEARMRKGVPRLNDEDVIDILPS